MFLEIILNYLWIVCIAFANVLFFLRKAILIKHGVENVFSNLGLHDRKKLNEIISKETLESRKLFFTLVNNGFTILFLSGCLIFAGYLVVKNKNKYENLPLLNATLREDITEVQTLLEQGVDVNTTDIEGNSALFVAAKKGNLAIVKLLIEYRADISAKNKYRGTALIIAANRGYLKVVEELVNSGCELNTANTRGLTALRCAVYEGYDPIVKLLIEAGANVNFRDREGGTALKDAKRKNHTNIVRMLIKAGAKE